MEIVQQQPKLPSFQEVFGFDVWEIEAPPPSKRSLRRTSATGDELSGRWTTEEHRLFLEGVALYGNDWRKMVPLIKTRTLIQIRTHAQKVFKTLGKKRRKLLAPDSASVSNEELVAALPSFPVSMGSRNGPGASMQQGEQSAVDDGETHSDRIGLSDFPSTPKRLPISSQQFLSSLPPSMAALLPPNMQRPAPILISEIPCNPDHQDYLSSPCLVTPFSPSNFFALSPH